MVKISLPEYFEIKTRKADNRGRVAIGSEYANREITVVVLGKKKREEKEADLKK